MHKWFLTIFILGLGLRAGEALSADVDPQNMVKYRAQVMGAMGKHMKMSSMIIKGEVNRVNDAAYHAEALHKTSKILLDLFPEGTGPDAVKTETKSEAWTDRDGFKAAVKAYADATANYVEVASTGDLDKIKGAFGQVGKSCGGCHDKFQVDDD
jgi:cytochrome c556